MEMYLELFIASGLFALLLTPFVQSLGRRAGACGAPEAGRKRVGTPCLGGLAVYLSALVAWCLIVPIPRHDPRELFAHVVSFLALIIPATWILILGVYDDLMGASPRQKLAGQCLAASMAWWAGARITRFPLLGYGIHSRLISFVLSVLWIVAATNAFNLIDGMDGLASGVGLLVALTLFVFSLIQANLFAAVIAVGLAGALAGFLPFNFDPAKIYLGDTGSLFLGFVFSVLAIDTSDKSATMLAIAVPYMALGLPLLDTGLTVIRRFLSGKPFFTADTDHIHHRVFQKYKGTRPAVFTLYLMAAMFSVGSLLMDRSVDAMIAVIGVLGAVCAWFVASQLRYVELTELNRYVGRALRSQRHVLANQVRLRKASARLEQADGIEEVWRVLTQTLEDLDFDGLEFCPHTRDGKNLKLPLWHRVSSREAVRCWSAVIPLHHNGRLLAELRLARSLAKGRLLFQFSSVLDTLIPPFEQKVVFWYAEREFPRPEVLWPPPDSVNRVKAVAKKEQHETTFARFENAQDLR